ncbi:MAG: phenylalanine--tRNA ligase subunit beta [Acidobacteriota bacterium]
MKVLLSWIREFVDVPGTAAQIGARLSERGLALESLEALDGGDAVLDFEVTANRPDNLSIAGIAREMATAYGLPLAMPGPAAPGRLRTPALPAVTSAGPVTGEGLAVRIDAPDLCGRYVGAVAEVAIGPSPDWLARRLAACGVRPISNIVDVTNYVLLELGHPMHAFDHARLAGQAIVVRRAAPGETLTTLDGKARTLTPDMLVIADAERPSAVGGVMGGADSEVTASTTRIVLEAAWFKPQSIRATARQLGLRTEASYRFERGADLTAALRAMARAAALIEQIGAGRVTGAALDCYPAPQRPLTLPLAAARVNGLLGMDVPDDEVVRILTSLGFEVRAEADPPRRWAVTVPAWRVDVQRPVDLIEEVGRHHGFEHLPATFPAASEAPGPSDPRIARDTRVRRALLAMGFSEAITFAFVDAAAAAPFHGSDAPVTLANPLSEKFTTMRPSLLPGLIDAVGHNRRRGRRDVRLFEIGTTFSPRGETRAAGAVWTGLATPDHWSGGRREVDFFDLKGAVEQIGAVLGVEVGLATSDRPCLVPGRAAEIRAGERTVGLLGQLDPALADARGLPAADAVYVAEIDLGAMTAAAPVGVRFVQPLPRHPHVVRDISVLVDDSLSAATVRGTIQAAAPPTLVGVTEFDRYQGTGIPDGKVSLSLRLTFQAPDRTLTDDEVHSGMQAIIAALVERLGALQR